ncbi:MAG: N-acetylmuramoyl-L-alanine amidase [Chitinivibrionales bacterium]
MINKQIYFVRTVLFMISVLTLIIHAELRIECSTKKALLPTRRIHGAAHVSLPALVRELDYSWSWEEESGTFTASRNTDTVSCYTNRNHVRRNGRVFQIPLAPVRFRGTVLLDVTQIPSLFTSSDGGSLYLAERGDTLKLVDSDGADKGHNLQATFAPVPVDNVWGDSGIRTIVIDPGHGGKDPGAIGAGGIKEKDLVLGIGLLLRDALKEKDFTVYMTRNTDRFLSLKQRTAFANEKKADLFVSIHADAIPGSRKKKESIKGFKIYFLSDAKSEEDRLVAMRENAVVELEENHESQDYLHNILTEMISAEHLIESQDLSIMIAKSFEKSLSETRKLHRGVGQARFYVLNGAFMPAVLVETGFVSNSVEAKLLSMKKYQKKMAGALLTAIMDFKKKYEIGL